MVRWTSAAVIAADGTCRTRASGVRAHIDLARTVHARRREGTNLASPVPARHVLEVQLHEFPCRRHRLFLVAELERSRSRRIISLVSTNGPSTTLSLPSVIRTCAPVATGISPPLSIMRPALISRSASLPIASIRAGVGPRVGWDEVTIYMKRMVNSR
jgi:hypothetical protein